MSEFLYSVGAAVGAGIRIAPGNPRFELAKVVRSGSLGKFASQSTAEPAIPKWAAKLLPGTKFLMRADPDVARVLTGSS